MFTISIDITIPSNKHIINISIKDTKSNVEGKERLHYKLGEGGVDVYQK